jgi:hypothetical protein
MTPGQQKKKTSPSGGPVAVRHPSLSLPPTILAAVIVFLSVAGPIRAQRAEPVPNGRVFASSVFSIDEILSRPFDRDVPMGCTGDRVWASSPQGWAFGDDVQWLYLTNLRAFDLELRDEHGLLKPGKATYFPSHIHYEGAVREEMKATASFTFALDRVENPLSAPFVPEKRWTCWSSGRRGDFYEVDFGLPRQISGFDLFFFDDSPSGECRPPASFEVQAIRDGIPAWSPIAPTQVAPERPAPGENRVRFEPLVARRFRFQFQHSGDRFYTGLYGVRPIRQAGAPVLPEVSPLQISADKFITKSDILVSIVRVHNPTSQVQTLYVDPTVDLGTPLEYWDLKTVSGLIKREEGDVSGREPRSLSLDGRKPLLGRPLAFRFRYAVLDEPPRSLKVAGASSGRTASFAGFAKPMLDQESSLYQLFGHHIGPGNTKVFKAAFEIRPDNEPARIESALEPATDRALLIKAEDQDARDLRASQIKDHQSWFDSNLPYFDCSDPFIRKMYYHRAYVLRKNMIDPKLGRMPWPTQSEGRWRSTWYPNVISYGAGHQVREARWLRDPAYWQGHLRTWAENEKSDGVYPSHVLPSGPAGGQYTDWITSTAWEGQLVHPDTRFLSEVVDKLAANVRGWQKVYDPDGDGLLLVDSHWWTGMEYQPSFFFFSDFKVSRDFAQPAVQVSLDRVDLTAYNYGNALAVARIYKKLGQPAKAEEFDNLAAKISAAVLAKMWRPEKQFFYSLRSSDKALADVKEVIGVYPFYFGMVPWGKGYEAAWSSIIDPGQFWTKWPVASASRECPAFSQKDWPGDGRAAGCMWNGPTWPHANSLVMTAMARTLRATRDQKVSSSPLEPEHLWELFSSFTKAQFRNQDLLYPWTGEFYNGDTGAWKTAERDYNHSTWLDVLIPDLLGLVPRDDPTVEIDPLVPEDRLSYFILDGQRYRGHDLTIVWDSPRGGFPDRFGDGRKGLDLYVDGKLVAASPRIARLVASL